MTPRRDDHAHRRTDLAVRDDGECSASASTCAAVGVGTVIVRRKRVARGDKPNPEDDDLPDDDDEDDDRGDDDGYKPARSTRPGDPFDPGPGFPCLQQA
jgi:hypothetical protein